ncbi:MAG TPA: rhodanese-like domain-containing protein [Myxococcota bacterium]|nr:rhodanese-like domain-containing protein [Myxococcota bacterium]
MIRDRLKGALRKVALKAFGMEREASDRTTEKTRGSTEYDPSKIPKIVSGSGDMPLATDQELIGSTYLAAQLIGGVPGTIIDTRPPEEWMAGHIPGALLLPGDQIRGRPELLPGPSDRISVYDATGEQGAFGVAEKLREQGFRVCRSLQSGWAGWIEHGEPVEKPEARAGHNLGDSVETNDGRRGVIQGFGQGTVDLLCEDGPALGVAEAELK